MLRHGELISTPGTIDKVPALDFCYIVPSDDFATATFQPTLDPSPLTVATYDVYAWWTAHSNRATNAHFTIVHANGTSVRDDINQQENGGQWVLLGQYDFNAGSSGYVELSNDGSD